MLFNSYSFLLFFPIVCLVYFVIPKKVRWVWLLAASYFFYMSWNPVYALLIAFCTVATYLAGIFLEHFRLCQKRQKLVVTICLLLNLGILVYFKYMDFLIESVNRVLALLGDLRISSLNLVLPVGISFYTFQAIGYTIDVFRGDTKAEKNIFRYALFVSFFPQLVAGPIERSKNLLNQVREDSAHKSWDYERITSGFMTMLWGYFLKMVISDRISIYVDKVFQDYSSYNAVILLLAAIGFAIQIYCDFGGYSAIAIGGAKVLGYDLMENFRTPYFSAGITEFWNRWHISLSTWFRDYLYIPLGGNRVKKWKHYRNLVITFLVSGLWHGASWHYVVWGGIHGVLQILEREWKKVTGKLPVASLYVGWIRSCVQRVMTFLLLVLTWVFFRAQSVTEACLYIKGIFSFGDWLEFDWKICPAIGIMPVEMKILVFSVAILFLVDLVCWKKQMTFVGVMQWCPIPVRWGILFTLLFSCVVFGIYGPEFDASQFIYFQF